MTGRYPFVPGATNEIPLDDFARLFSPGGLIDGFFNTQLRPYVDTSGAKWTPHPESHRPPSPFFACRARREHLQQRVFCIGRDL